MYIPEEAASPTQPPPVAPPPLAKQKYSADDAWGINGEERAVCRKQLEDLRLDGIFTPPSVNGTLSVPGNIGGLNWSGYAFDPNTGVLFANTNNLPFKVRLIPRASFEQRGKRTNERISEQGEYGPQLGGPYAMFRRPLFSPNGGKQYVVIAAGGHAKIEEESLGDALIAFALP